MTNTTNTARPTIPMSNKTNAVAAELKDLEAKIARTLERMNLETVYAKRDRLDVRFYNLCKKRDALNAATLKRAVAADAS